MPLNNIQYENSFILSDVPVHWLTYRFQFFDIEFPQFPMYYIHLIVNGQRIYGFPFLSEASNYHNSKCDVSVKMLMNIDIENNAELKRFVAEELKHRIGLADRVTQSDVMNACNGNREYEDIFMKLWSYVQKVYGESIPFGRFFEEIDSIVRFVSAWNPKTGRQSEMRMRYNFYSAFGEDISVNEPWNFFSFSLLPTASEIINDELDDFPKFRMLINAIEKIWDRYYIKHQEIDGIQINSMAHAWPQNKESFIDEVTKPMLNAGQIDLDEKFYLDRLVDAFNRHAWRAAYFIWGIMTLKISGFSEWSKDTFVKFYLNNNGVGISEKVTACFLQQGFGNKEVIPIDTWIEAFYKYALGIKDKYSFFNSFSLLGKLERVIWLSSQANKINLKSFFNLMWCTRFGNRGNSDLREANPISCYECELRTNCPGYNLIKNKNVLVKNEIAFDDLQNTFREARVNNCEFILQTCNSVPEKVFKKNRTNYRLIDEFSGYLLTDETTDLIDQVCSVENLINSLPEFHLR